ncbi:MAG TPA: hypothetical protein VIT23_07370, partial [Terrimicrobiaceae bacterium]
THTRTASVSLTSGISKIPKCRNHPVLPEAGILDYIPLAGEQCELREYAPFQNSITRDYAHIILMPLLVMSF